MHKILVVEDETGYQKILKDALEKDLFKVTVVADVKRAMAEVAKELPDIILLDIMLPGGSNGFNFLGHLKVEELTRNIPVVIITNVPTEAEVAKGMGAHYYFIKSECSVNQIVEQVKEIRDNPKTEVPNP